MELATTALPTTDHDSAAHPSDWRRAHRALPGWSCCSCSSSASPTPPRPGGASASSSEWLALLVAEADVVRTRRFRNCGSATSSRSSRSGTSCRSRSSATSRSTSMMSAGVSASKPLPHRLLESRPPVGPAARGVDARSPARPRLVGRAGADDVRRGRSPVAGGGARPDPYRSRGRAAGHPAACGESRRLVAQLRARHALGPWRRHRLEAADRGGARASARSARIGSCSTSPWPTSATRSRWSGRSSDAPATSSAWPPACASFADVDHLDTVREYLRHPAWQVRVQAVNVLGRLGSTADVKAIAAAPLRSRMVGALPGRQGPLCAARRRALRAAAPEHAARRCLRARHARPRARRGKRMIEVRLPLARLRVGGPDLPARPQRGVLRARPGVVRGAAAAPAASDALGAAQPLLEPRAAGLADHSGVQRGSHRRRHGAVAAAS